MKKNYQIDFVDMYIFTHHLHQKQDMIQGQFFSWFEFRVFLLLDWLPYQG